MGGSFFSFLFSSDKDSADYQHCSNLPTPLCIDDTAGMKERALGAGMHAETAPMSVGIASIYDDPDTDRRRIHRVSAAE